MGYRNLQECVADLRRHDKLLEIREPLSSRMEVGAVQRRMYAAGGPALLFTNVRETPFPLLGNLFGTLERTRFLFRDTLATIDKMVQAKRDPRELLRHPWQARGLPRAALNLLPRNVSSGPAKARSIALSDLPQLVSWPQDGGAFITLPQVYSEDPNRLGYRHSNLGMYRVQMSGNEYGPSEAGLHYQIHRGIGVHQRHALEQGKDLHVNVFVGGAPSMTVAAVMPLPEGMPELSFAGVLAGHRIPMLQQAGGLPFPAQADFVLRGTVSADKLKPEGPFGDHLGYYSLTHDFPVLDVQEVYCRKDAIWPFTTVGRPPQEDTSFGTFIHELTGELIPEVLPGICEVHAVDAAGVHPLLLAIGSERYTPYQELHEPQELLTQANAILGHGQLSLAKFLFIAARQDSPQLHTHNIRDFFCHMLERVSWERDLHFQTRTTVDTLDYTGHGLNQGSKVVIAAAGPKRRDLDGVIPAELNLPEGYHRPTVAMPGVLVVSGPAYSPQRDKVGDDPEIKALCHCLDGQSFESIFPLVVVVDDSEFVARTEENFLWVTFTRSNPATDIYGVKEFIRNKHWGCAGPLVIDARTKSGYPPSLEETQEVTAAAERLFASDGPLARWG
ncbi:UbiD family decarboxylase [Desulfurispira natronophila]|uniref:4-hydroxy-3-polyprenylbenzoate decarboxylase n=1 Tax=Desulfurispira natronophila TaxID=682562 RepID=A0A7W8DHA5_9BACT|nr:UbiD family decarboxylase [Desulfurispira natronophila]MBB5022290.1 4-hydroxy-3-polyprenylbenzoate decarboxylase [Desulfurispira natronophila]